MWVDDVNHRSEFGSDRFGEEVDQFLRKGNSFWFDLFHDTEISLLLSEIFLSASQPTSQCFSVYFSVISHHHCSGEKSLRSTLKNTEK